MRVSRFGIVAAVLFAVEAHAQAIEPLSASTDGGLGEIVVTAQRRAERAQDVPIALSVVDHATLIERGATTVNGIDKIVPSLEIEPAFGGGQPQFRLRGVGFEDYASNNTPTVGTYIDGVAYPIPANTQGLLFDIDRVEILKGPQGTLYGRNTTGGALNIATGAPTPRFSAGALAEYGRFDSLRTEGFVSGPLAEGLTARLSVGSTQGGGFQRERTTGQHLGDQDVIAGRVKLRYNPSSAVDVTLTGQYNRDRSDGTGVYLFRPTPLILGRAATPGGPPTVVSPMFPADTSRRVTGFGLSPSFAALLGLPTNQKPFRDNDSYTGSVNAAFDLGFGTLTSISAYQNLNRIELNDWAALELGNSDVYFRSKADVFSQEFRLASNGEGRLRWLIGGYYSNEKLNEVYRSDFLEVLALNAYTPYRQRVESISGFGQLDFRLTDKITLTGGGRYEFETRRLIGLQTSGAYPNGRPAFGNFPALPPGAVVPFADPQNRRTTLNEPTGKIGIEYRPGANRLFYLSASKGVKSGGFTALNTVQAQAVDPFKPETLFAYEAGFKGDFADHRVRLNASVYYYDYYDQQVQGIILGQVNGQQTIVGRITNAPRSEIYGGELDLTVRPVEAFTLHQSFGYVEGQYKRFIDPGVDANNKVFLVDRAGQKLGFPYITYSGDARYALPVGVDYTLTPELDWYFRDRSTLAVLRTAGNTFTIAPYWLVDASLTLAPRNGRWSAGLWGRNITNSGYDLARNFFIGGFDIAAPGQPATYGVRGSVKF